MDRPDREEELSPTSASGRTSSTEKNKPAKKKSFCLGEETTSPAVVKKRKCVSDGCVAHTYSGPEKNKPAKRKSLWMEEEEKTSPDVVKKSLCSVGRSAAEHQVSVPGQQGDDKRREVTKRPAPDAEHQVSVLGQQGDDKTREVTKRPAPDAEHQVSVLGQQGDDKTREVTKRPAPDAEHQVSVLGQQGDDKTREVTKRPAPDAEHQVSVLGQQGDDKTREVTKRPAPDAEHQVSVLGQQGDDKTREVTKRPAPDAECSSWPAKKQRQGPSGNKGKEESKDYWKLPDRRRPAGEKQQQFSAEERHAVSLLQEAGVPLLDERQEALLSSKAHETLGAGAFGSCCKVWDPHSGEELVIKTYYSGSVGDLVKEASILQRLQVVAGVQRLVGACVRRRWLVTRYAGLTVERYFATDPSLPDLLSVVLQVARTLQELAREGYAHNDIKGDNLCVRNGSQGPEATVIDLGVAERPDMRQINRNEEPEPFTSWLVPRLPLDVPPWIRDIDTYDLASIIRHALAMHGGLSSAPCLSPIRAWVNAVIRPGPGERPTLQALIHMLEALLEALQGGQTQGGAAVTLPPGGGGLTEQRAANTPLQAGGVHAQRRAAVTPRLNGCGLNRRATKEEGSDGDEGSEYH
ncbi:uncharacterized protein LOC126994550 [Eriocheir sinensis]|uniref:uncharacterized protein LOC126994550 n=1 Tax=Eriocheir sinensis TaxID=95602 RepID=UPI0021C689AB|nr:uncharacterized protein LOC126994550 [Eriocheir sinensis]